MSLRIYVAHTGAQLDADPTSFDSLDALRAWISQVSSIPLSDQILLTTKGRHVKLPALSIEVFESSDFGKAIRTNHYNAG